MNKCIDINQVDKKINLPGGFSLVLLDRLAKESIYGQLECARNIFLVDAASEIVWQIQTDFDADSGSFTNIFLDENGFKGYRWDGGIYEINLQSGKAAPALLIR
jgi:hypothetical protein